MNPRRPEEAELLRSLGAADAMNLDGGLDPVRIRRPAAQ
jgi:hypothetical protein